MHAVVRLPVQVRELVGADGEVLADTHVLTTHPEEERDDRRDEDQYDPCTVCELRGGDHDGDHTGRGRPQRVDHERALPARLAETQMVAHHARLRERERQEHADRIQRDETRGDAAKGHEQYDRGDREQDDAVAEHEPVAAVPELVRQEVVIGHERGEAREISVGGVGGQHEDRCHARRYHVVQPPRTEHLPGKLADHGLGLRGLNAGERGEQHDAGEQEEQDARHPGQRDRGVLVLGLAERLHPVGDGLHAGHRGATRRERLEYEEQSEALHDLDLLGRRGNRERVARGEPDKAGDDHEADQHDEGEGGSGKERPGLLDATQVRDGEQQYEPDRHRHGVGQEPGSGRGDRRHRGRDRDGHSEDVVDQERRPGHETRYRAEVLLGHDVGAATARVLADRLAVRQHHDHEQHADGHRDREREAERRRAGEREHEHDLLRRVGDRRKRVAREDRERDRVTQALVHRLTVMEWIAEQEPLQWTRHRPPYRLECRMTATSVLQYGPQVAT